MVNPAGARPAALTNLPGAGAAGAAAAAVGYPLAVLPGEVATFTSAPVTRRPPYSPAPNIAPRRKPCFSMSR